MAKPMRLRYHQQTFDLLQETPVVSATSVRLIEKWERKNKARLPGAVLEWYSLEGAERRGIFDATGFLNSIPWILDFHTKFQRKGRIDLSKEFHIYQVGLYHEDFTVIARYDGTEDPPVVERVDEADHNPFNGKRLRFSAFVFQWVWELLFANAAERNQPVLLATETEVGPVELDFLLENLTECFRSRRFHGRRQMESPFCKGKIIKLFPYQFAFQNPSGLVSINCQANPVRQPTEAKWRLLARTEQGLFDLAKRFWGCGDFSKTLTAGNETSKAILTQLRRHVGSGQ